MNCTAIQTVAAAETLTLAEVDHELDIVLSALCRHPSATLAERHRQLRALRRRLVG